MLAPGVQRWCEEPLPDWAICWRIGGKRERNDFSDTSHIQPGSVSLTSLTSAVALSLGAITRLFMSQGSVVASALQPQAAPWLDCSSPTPLPLNPHIDIYYFSSHIKGGKGEECQQLISRLVLKFCFSMANVRICVHPFKRGNEANELAVQEVWCCAWPRRDREIGSRGNIKTKLLLAECLVL